MKDNLNKKYIFYAIAAIFVPAIPVLILTDFYDFIKCPVFIIFVAIYSLIESEPGFKMLDVAVITIFYFLFILLGIKFPKKKTIIIIAIFSAFNMFLYLNLMNLFV